MPTGPARGYIAIEPRSGRGWYDTATIASGDAVSWGPFTEDVTAQVHGIVDARLEYVIAPPVGTYGGISPDRGPLPAQRTPLLIPTGAALTIANVGAGTRAPAITFLRVRS